MASVDFQKLKSPQEVKAMLRHSDKEERKRHEHSNKQINKAFTDFNIQLNLTYEQSCERYDKLIEYLDSQEGANKKKDRVLCFGLEIPCPAEINTPKDENRFFKRVIELIAKQYGASNIIAAYFHRDEKHTYRDKDTHEWRESLNHGHVYVVPNVNGKLNGKAFSSLRNINKINEAVHLMCQQEFGVDFMNGTKKKSRSSVEQLKNQSREIEQQEKLADLKYILANAEERERSAKEYESFLKGEQGKLYAEMEEVRKTQIRASESASAYEDGIKQVEEIVRKYRSRGEDDKADEIQEQLLSVTQKTDESVKRAQTETFTEALNKFAALKRQHENERDNNTLSAEEAADWLINRGG
ncbi:MAG: plasmid recombination protein [Oscillospiraceae bacterium]|nr:plasmid recombination protein [Oscillospiraceae bacterium]